MSANFSINPLPIKGKSVEIDEMIISCPNNNWSSLFRGLDERLILFPRLIFLGVLFANVRFWNPAFTKDSKLLKQPHQLQL